MNKKIRVLHAPTTVGGNSYGLSQQLNLLGMKSTTLTLLQNYLNYPTDIILWKGRKNILWNEIKRVVFIITMPFKYDVVHYNFGTTVSKPLYVNANGSSKVIRLIYQVYSLYSHVLQKLELNLLKICNIPVFVHYQGSDARQAQFGLQNYKYSIATQINEGFHSTDADIFKKKSIEYLTKFCDGIYAVNPDLLNFLPKKACFIPYCHIALDEWKPVYSQHNKERPLVIGHAPTNRNIKGTKYILNAVEELKKEGYECKLVLIENLSNKDAKKKYETIDVFVDQLFAGWYGGLAVEVMALGKPVLVYIRESDLNYIPNKMKAELPFLNVTPDTIKHGLKTVLEMSSENLLIWAKHSRQFVEAWHEPSKIAEKVKSDYERSLKSRSKK